MEALPSRPRRDKAKKAAREFLLSSRQAALPVDVEDLFRQNGWSLTTLSQAEALAGSRLPAAFRERETAEAMTCFYRGSFFTIYKTQNRTPGRIRFTQAHELGHIVLGHLTGYPLGDSFSVQRCRQAKALEREADLFAAELLAPTPVLQETGLSDPLRIQAVCGLSRRAADIVISDIHRDLDLREAERYRMLCRFHPYLWRADCNRILYEMVCPVCKAQLGEESAYCPVCGTKAGGPLHKGHPVVFRPPAQTGSGRLLYCPRCGNTAFSGGARACSNCGQPLYNHCVDPRHPKLLPGFARHCPVCGGRSSFYDSGILSQWQASLREEKQKTALWGETVCGAPVSAQWDFWVERVLIRERLELYIRLRDSSATLEYGDLTIYTKETGLPRDYIRDSIGRWCGIEIVSVQEAGEDIHDLSQAIS